VPPEPPTPPAATGQTVRIDIETPEPPKAPTPPEAPSASNDAPKAPEPPKAPTPPEAPVATGQTIRIDREDANTAAATDQTIRLGADTTANDSAPPDRDAERAAILQMVAEGRLTPEEGDLLLDALN
jgi:hypothetical protein